MMVSSGETICPNCNGKLKYFDGVKRIVRTKSRRTEWIELRRLRCVECGALHRELPEELYPYKQYEAEVIQGVIEGIITCETLGYEDYPCEMTMIRWISQKSYLLLRKMGR